jgi:hypothetical protein
MSPENEVVDYYANEGVGYAQGISSRYMIQSLMRRLIKIPEHLPHSEENCWQT